MHLDIPELTRFLTTGMLWVGASVCLLWMCQQIVAAAATRLLMPVLWVLAFCNAFELYFWIKAFRPDAAHQLTYWLAVALRILMLCLLIPKLRQSMWVISLVLIPSFVVFVTPWFLRGIL